jgi:predicted nucleic acid-binding Zn ribbon protein
LSEAEQVKKKPYIYQHRHCVYCGRMIEVKGRTYCLRCKPEYTKETAKVDRSKKFQKMLLVYMVIVVVVIVALFIYSYYSGL